MTINLCGDCRHYRLRMSEAPCASCSISDSKWEPVMFDKLFTKKPDLSALDHKPGERHPLDKPGERHPLDKPDVAGHLDLVFSTRPVPITERAAAQDEALRELGEAPLYRPLDQVAPATARQVGGGHYKDMKIQPVEYILANGMGYLEGNVVKYISRHGSKGKEEDVRKAIHYCQLILQMQYGADE